MEPGRLRPDKAKTARCPASQPPKETSASPLHGSLLTQRLSRVPGAADQKLGGRLGKPELAGLDFGDHLLHHGRAVMPLTFGYSVGPIDIEIVRREMPWAVLHDVTVGSDFVFVSEHPQIIEWVHEARQIRGRYTLTGEDVMTGRQFDDVIAQCCYCVDIHEPNTDGTTCVDIGGPGHYDIPWHCLVPMAGPTNLVVGGRCISATHEAMSSFRVSPSAMAIGEAAGVTAALAAQNGIPIADVSPLDVQHRLRATGGILS